MPLSKKARERLWTRYLIGMAVCYFAAFGIVTLLTGQPSVGFLAAFASLFVTMIGFLIVMRRLGAAAPGPRS